MCLLSISNQPKDKIAGALTDESQFFSQNQRNLHSTDTENASNGSFEFIIPGSSKNNSNLNRTDYPIVLAYDPKLFSDNIEKESFDFSLQIRQVFVRDM